jgi:hypothetical protein
VQTGQLYFIALERYYCEDRPDVFYYLAEVLLYRQARCISIYLAEVAA